MTSYVYMSLWLDQRWRRDLFQIDQLQCSHFGFNLTVSTFGTDDTSSKVNGLWIEERKETKQSQVLTRNWLWSGSELVVVWIGLDPGLDRPRSGPTCLCMLQLACSITRKGPQGVQAASVQLGCLAGWLYNLQQCQLGSLTAWMHNSCSLAAGLLSSVALQLGSPTARQRGFTTVLLLGCLARWITAEQETQKHDTITGPDINSPKNYIIPKVWIKGLDQILSKGLDRRSGSEVWIVCGTGAWSRPYILSRSHIYMSP